MVCKWTKLNYAVHPGEILKEYLLDKGMTQIELAKAINVNKIMINEIVNGKRPISLSTALKLEQVFSFEAQFWRNLQMIYDEAIERLRIKKTTELVNYCSDEHDLGRENSSRCFVETTDGIFGSLKKKIGAA